MDPNSSLLLGPAQYLTEPCMEGGRSLSPREQSRCSPFAWSQVPSSSLSDPDCFGDEHIQAKRARVETIVRGMFLSPTSLGPGRALAGDSPSRPEKARGRKRKQSLPMQQDPLEAGPAGNRGSGRKGGRERSSKDSTRDTVLLKGTPFLLPSRQKMSEEGESQARSLPVRARSCGELLRLLRSISRSRAGPW